MLRIILLVLLFASPAFADLHEISFINTDETRNMRVLRLHTQMVGSTPRVTEIPVLCAPLEKCSVEVDLLAGEYTVWAQGAGSGTSWSIDSNTITVTVITPDPVNPLAACLELPPVMRADFDGDGAVTASDFGTFLSVFGSAWLGD